jgi:predicted tellurium resistance membrane protein TerC
MQKFYYLKPTLIVLLVFIGTKMLASDIFKIPIEISLIVIFAILGIALMLSALKTKRDNTQITLRKPKSN